MPPREVTFTVQSGPLKGLEYKIRKDVIKIGRTADNDVVLEQTSVSRSHATIRQVDGRLICEDLGSANKVKVNGKTVSRAFIPDQCIVTVGDVEILVRCEPASPPTGQTAEAPATSVEATVPVRTAVQTAEALPAEAAAPEDGKGAAPQSPPIETAPHEGRMRKAVLLVIVLSCFLLLAFFFIFSKEESAPEVVVKNIPVALKAGQERAVWVGEYRVVVDNADKAVATAEYDPWWAGILKVKGLSEGQTVMTLRSPDGGPRVSRLFVSVQGRAADDLVERYGPKLSDAKRRQISAQLKAEGDSALARSSWEAYRKYRDAVAILEPVSPKPKEFVEAEKAMAAASELWNKHYKDLYVQYYAARRVKDYALAIQRLHEIALFFNDPEDFRYQAALRTAEEIQALLDAEKRRRGY